MLKIILKKITRQNVYFKISLFKLTFLCKIYLGFTNYKYDTNVETVIEKLLNFINSTVSHVLPISYIK